MSFECCKFLFCVFFFVGKRIHFVDIFSNSVYRMSLSKYFEPVKDKAKGKFSDASSIALTLSNKDESGISREELITVSKELQDINDNKTATSHLAVHKDVDKIRIARYACENGKSKAVSKFKSDFLKLNESTERPWVKRYKSELSSEKTQTRFTI